MKDANGVTITVGDTLKRVVEGAGVPRGHMYKVVQYNFDDEAEGEDLVADGGFIKELITPERAKEYEVQK